MVSHLVSLLHFYTVQSCVGGVRGIHSFSIFNSLSSGSSLHLPPEIETAAFDDEEFTSEVVGRSKDVLCRGS